MDGAALGLRADEFGVPRTVGLAEGVATRDERDGLLVVHAHAAERHADVVGGTQRVGLTLRALGVDVDEAHRDGGEVALVEVEGVVLGVALVAEPGVLRAPEDLGGCQLSARPKANPKVFRPMSSCATLPARTRRSAQEILRPYFCLIGSSRRRALSRLALSGQLLSGAKR